MTRNLNRSHGHRIGQLAWRRWRSLLPVLLAVLIYLPSSDIAATETNTSAALALLAEAARTRMAQRIEPPTARLPFLCIHGRTRSAPVREYVLRQQALAVEALLASATTPASVEAVERILGELARDGVSNPAQAWLTGTAPGGPTGLRLGSAMGELPAALDARMQQRLPCSGSFIGLMGRQFEPLGARALADYRQLTEIEPDDPWHWLVLAWLAGVQGEPALQRSLEVARAQDTAEALRVRIFALQQLAWLRQQQGRGREAHAAALEAMQQAQQAADRAGATDQAMRDLGQAGSHLGLVLDDLGGKAAAFDVLSRVAPLQQRLADSRPDDLPAQYALIDTLARIGVLQPGPASPSASAPGGVTPSRLQMAVARYRQLQEHAPFSPMLGGPEWHGLFVASAALAGVLTLLLGWLLLWRYRRRVAQLMMTASSRRAAPTSTGEPATPRPEVALANAPSAAHPPAARAVASAQRQAAAVQVVAGLAFGLTAAWLQLRADGLEIHFNRIALMSWTWAWPTVLALGLVWDGDRRRKHFAWAAYFGVLLLICIKIASGDTPPLDIGGLRIPAFFQGLFFSAIGLSSLPFLLLFLNRSVRSVGPVLLAMMLAATACGTLAQVAASTPAGTDLLASVSFALRLPLGAVLPLTFLSGMLAAAPLAWWIGRRLHAAYAAKWLTDQSLMIDAIWLFQAVVLSLDLNFAIGPIGWMGMGAFALHKAIMIAGMLPAARAARTHAPQRLLLLRVFGRRDDKGRVVSRRGESERLFDLLGSRWRYAGPIFIISAPDLAGSTLDPDEFLDFLAGRLRERFIVEPGDLPVRLAAVDERCDFDARWRVTDLFCSDGTWRQAVLALMARSDLAAMDLRDFGPDNQGCVFELQGLVDLVPLRRVTLLVGRSTHRDFLQTTLQACLGRMPPTSPNVREARHITLVDIDAGEQDAVNQLMRMLEGPAGASD